MKAFETFREVAAVVARMHGARVAHGDLKPENILIGEGYLPWLTDFGMARRIHDARLDDQVSQSLSKTASRASRGPPPTGCPT